MADQLFAELEQAIQVSGKAIVMVGNEWNEVKSFRTVGADDDLAVLELPNRDRIIVRSSALQAIRLVSGEKQSAVSFYDNL